MRKMGWVRGKKDQETWRSHMYVRVSHRQTEAVGKEQGCVEYEGWP